MKKNSIKKTTNVIVMNTPKTYDRITIDSICAEATRNDNGYYDNDIHTSDSVDSIIYSLEALCDTL